jgi:Flp pilus assembly secretin CpaC
MIKVVATAVLGFLTAGIAAGTASGAERTIRVQADAAVTIDLGAEAKTVLVANPAIADVTPVNGQKLIVLGRGAGQTGLLIFDEAGKPLLEATVLVTPSRQWAVTVNRGVNATTLNCAPRCSDEPQGGQVQGGQVPAKAP